MGFSVLYLILLLSALIAWYCSGHLMHFIFGINKWRGMFYVFAAVVILYGMFLGLNYSLELPYIAPTWFSYIKIFSWLILLPLFMLSFFAIMFVRRPYSLVEHWQKSLINYKTTQRYLLVLLPVLLAITTVYLMDLLPILPTEYLAKKSFQHYVDIERVECVPKAKLIPAHTNFVYYDRFDQDEHKISVMGDVCYKNPQIQQIAQKEQFVEIGREWAFGQYVDALVPANNSDIVNILS